MTDSPSPTPPELKLKHTPPKRAPILERVLLGTTFLSTGMLFIAAEKLIGGSGALDNAKVVLISVSGGLVSYGVNFAAIRKGAPLAAVGFTLAGVVSALGIAIVGGGMFISTFAGLTMPAVEQRQLEQHGEDVRSYIAYTNRIVLDAAKAAPVIELIVAESQDVAVCELRRSCFSGKGYGGRGPVTRALESAARKAGTVSTSFRNGAANRQPLLEKLNLLTARFGTTLADADLSESERRPRLQQLHGEIEQIAAELAETLPTSILKSFVQDLRKGVVIEGDAATTRKLNKFLEAQAERLENAMPSTRDARNELTPFPPRPGMMDALGYISDFAALAAIIAVAELSLPMTLFVLTWLSLAWELERRGASGTRQRSETDAHGFGDLLDLPPVDVGDEEEIEPAQKPVKRGPGRPRKST